MTFAGAVAGTLHVVVRHADGLRSTYADVSPRSRSSGASRLSVGQVVAIAGPGFHLTARLGDTYLDPALLFAGAVLELSLVAGPAPPAALGTQGSEGPGGGGLAGSGRGRWDPILAVLHDAQELTFTDQISTAAVAVDEWQHQDCTPDAALIGGGGRGGIDSPPPIPKRSRVLVQVGGLGTNHESSSLTQLDPVGLGYHPDDVVGFSYAGGCTPQPFGLAAGPDALSTALGPTEYQAHDTFQDVNVSAQRLADLIDSAAAERPAASVDVVAHSLGGVVARRAVEILAERHGAGIPVDVVMTIGSPHQGADLATMATASSGGLGLVDLASSEIGELRDSPVVVQLSEAGISALPAPEGVPEGVVAVSVAGSVDLIVPAEQTLWPGATNVLVNQSPVSATSTHGVLPGLPEVARELDLARAGWAPRCVGLGQILAGVGAGTVVAGGADALSIAAGVISQYIN